MEDSGGQWRESGWRREAWGCQAGQWEDGVHGDGWGQARSKASIRNTEPDFVRQEIIISSSKKNNETDLEKAVIDSNRVD